MTDTSSLPLTELDIDPSERPSLPKMPQATDQHRRQGRRLAAIHRRHLGEFARIAKTLEQIEAGETPPGALINMVQGLDMTQNYRAFGSLCGQECRMLTFHHDAEEHMVFPQLEAAGDNALRALVARLRQEHKIVHELLERLEQAAMTLLYEPEVENFTDARDIFHQLEKVVRSHFGYEETELEEALGVHLGDML